MVITLLFLLGATVLDSDSSALFLSADQLERTELHEDAARLFCQCADQSEVLRSYALSRAAKNYYIAGNDEAAESLFQQVVATYPEDPCIRLTWKRMGDFYFQQGRVVEARRYYNKALAALKPLPWFLDKLAWNNADYALQLSGYEDEGYVWFRHIAATTLYRARRASAAKRLLESKNGEYRIWGIYGYVRSGKLRTAREALLKEEALVLQGAEETVSPLLALDAILGTAQTDLSGTHKRLAAILQQNQDLLWVRVWLMLAVREQAGSKHYSAAEMLAQLLSENFPDGRDAGDVYWWFSVHYEAVSDKEAASRMYRQLVERHPEHVRAPRSLLYLANYARDTGNAEEAFRIYDNLGHTFPGERLAAEGLYRAAELAERIGDTERQQGYLNKAAGVGPGHFYAHRACHKLRTQFEAAPGVRTLHICEEDNFLHPLSLPLKKNKGLDFLIVKDPSYQRLNFFGIHGLEEGEWEALACIIAASDSIKKIWYPAIAEAGFAHTLHQFIYDQEWGMKNGVPTIIRLRTEYPRAYWQQVYTMAKELDIDPYLLLAVARQESTFRANIVSSAGATGVLQVMPSTAKWLAKVDSRISADHIQNLKSPRNSIRLGAVYLQRMLRRSQNNMVYALASYNAGPGNCDKWRTRFPNYALDKFADAIPFYETNRYVKKVLANYAAYHSLYSMPDETHKTAEQ